MPKQHTIELNGNRYDAVTGELLVNNPLSSTAGKQARRSTKTRSVDGFTRHKPSTAHPNNPVQTVKTQKSKTLMRKTVPRPIQPKPATSKAKVSSGPIHIKSFVSISQDKLAHAKVVKKSSLIRKFSEITLSRSRPEANTQPTKLRRLQAVATATAVLANPLEDGLNNATSHNEAKTPRQKRHVRVANRLRISPRVLSGGSILLSGLLITGFFAYQNIPNFQMRLYSSRAGVRASMPSYKPAGFDLKGGITYKAGQVTVGYKSNSDDRNYKITQTASSWNSEALLDNFLVANKRLYSAIPDKGKVIYLYEGSNATWVDGGVWYRIEGNSQLSSDQLLNLANSL